MTYLIAFDPDNTSGRNPNRPKRRRPSLGWQEPVYVTRLNSNRLQSFVYYGAAVRLCQELNKNDPGSHFIVED